MPPGASARGAIAPVGQISAQAAQPSWQCSGAKRGMPSTPAYPSASPRRGQGVVALPSLSPKKVHSAIARPYRAQPAMVRPKLASLIA